MAENNKETKKEDQKPAEKKTSFFETKTFRILTLGIYLGGLSGMGMTLAIYHLFLWDSEMPPLPEIKHHHHVG